MELALIAFRQILNMVILMMVGLMSAKLKIIDDETNKKLSSFLLMIITPAVVFMSYQRAFEEELLNGLLISLVLAIVSFTLKIIIAQLTYRNKGEKSYAIERFACVYSNCGFIGIPLIQGIFGSEGVFFLTAYLTMFNLMLWTHGIMVMSGKSSITFLKKALLSPAIVATIVGFSFFMLQIELPNFLAEPIQIVGGMNTPMAMIVAGVSISKAKISKIVKDVRILKICLMRLLVIPGVLIVVFSFWYVPSILTGTSIVAASCPVAASLILFAYRYDKDHIYSAELFAASTILSMFTIPILLLFI